MARYVLHVRSPKAPDEAFDFMADLTNFADWDPGVVTSVLITGDEPAQGAEFDVAVRGIGKPMTLRYRLEEYDPPNRVVAKAVNRLLTSVDTISIREDEGGSIVTYDADLTLNGILGAGDLVLRPAFNKIADRAAKGLVKALDGQRIDSPDS